MLVGHVFRRRVAAGNAGIVDQDIHAAMPAGEFLGYGLDARRIRHVHVDDFDGKAGRAHRRLALGGYLGVVVGDDDARARFGKGLDAGEPDGLTAAGDES